MDALDRVAAHADGKRVGLRIGGHEHIFRLRADMPVRNEAVEFLEQLYGGKRVAAKGAVRLCGQVSELIKPLLVFQHVIALFPISEGLCNRFLAVKHFARLHADHAVHVKVVAFLKFLHGSGRFVPEIACRLFHVIKLDKTLLQFLYIRAFIADRDHIRKRILTHEAVIGFFPDGAVHREAVAALEHLNGALCDAAVILSRFIVIHIAKLHQTLLHGDDLRAGCAFDQHNGRGRRNGGRRRARRGRGRGRKRACKVDVAGGRRGAFGLKQIQLCCAPVLQARGCGALAERGKAEDGDGNKHERCACTGGERARLAPPQVLPRAPEQAGEAARMPEAALGGAHAHSQAAKALQSGTFQFFPVKFHKQIILSSARLRKKRPLRLIVLPLYHNPARNWFEYSVNKAGICRRVTIFAGFSQALSSGHAEKWYNDTKWGGRISDKRPENGGTPYLEGVQTCFETNRAISPSAKLFWPLWPLFWCFPLCLAALW